MDSSILSVMSENITADLPHVCLAPPAEGYTIALSVTDEGKRVLVFAEEHLQPEQYRRLNDRMTVVDADLESEIGLYRAWEALQDVYDAIFFIGDIDRFSGEAELTDAEDDLITAHLRFLLGSRGRYIKLGPSGRPVENFPSEPLKVKFVEGAPPVH